MHQVAQKSTTTTCPPKSLGPRARPSTVGSRKLVLTAGTGAERSRQLRRTSEPARTANRARCLARGGEVGFGSGMVALEYLSSPTPYLLIRPQGRDTRD